jgi:hypothetical protein
MSLPLPRRQNSAGRLLEIVNRAQPSSNKSAIDGWAEVFEVPDNVTGLERQHEVSKLLSVMTQEVRSMERQLRSQGVGDELLGGYVDQLAQSAAVGNLANHWQNLVTNHLGSEVRLSLRWFNYVLPEEALTASVEDLRQLEELLTDLESKAGAEGVPPSLSDFIHRQVAAVRDALRQYPIGGPAALRSATRKMAADIALDEDEIRHAARGGDPQSVAATGESLKQVWKKASEVAGDVEKFAKAGKAVLDLGERLVAMLPSPTPPT